MGDLAIRASNLSKQYTIGRRQTHHDTLRDQLADGVRRILMRTGAPQGGVTFWGLQDVSFEIRRGEVVGVIGRNGAGKSTLLKILSRITEPTTGTAEIRGRISSLLEVGTGFHPELTGRENIYLNGAILGMRRSEIDQARDGIIAFAEVEQFIDTPVKRYSSGMHVRLAFAVAAHLQPEILLVDEVLAVGDAQFQKKCLGKMADVAREGRTVLFVSHNMGAIAQLCERALWLNDGRLRADGPAPGVVSAYLSSNSTARSVWRNPLSDGSGHADCQFRSVRILSMDGQPISVAEFKDSFQVEIEYEVARALKDLSIICRLVDSLGATIWVSWDSDATGWKAGDVRAPGRYRSICHVPANLLRPGIYQVHIGARSADVNFPAHENVVMFEVSDVGYTFNPGRIGAITPLLEWVVHRSDGNDLPQGPPESTGVRGVD